MTRSLLVLAAAATPAAAFSTNGQAFLGNGMQPEVVARTLRNVEEEWKAQVALFASCDTEGKDGDSLVDCSDAPASFGKSCKLVVNAVVQGATGDKTVAKEYMTDVCGQSSIKGWHQQKCQGLAVAISGAMSADSYENRYNFNSAKLCTGFWSTFLKEEKTRMEEEKAAKEVADKKAEDEEKAEQEAADKKAKEDAEKKKVQEAAAAKEAAKVAAEEAAAKVEQKKAEAAAVAKAAELKMAEAKQAEQEHQQAVKKEEAEKAKEAASKPVEVKAAPQPAAEVKVAPVPVVAKVAVAPAVVEAKKVETPVKAAAAPVEAKATVAAKK